VTQAAPNPDAPRTRSRAVGALVLAVVAALAAVVGISVHLRDGERERTVQTWRSRLEALADARKRSVQAWLAERRSDAEVLAWDPDLIGLCAEGACPKGVDPVKLRSHLDNLQRFAGFLGAYLFTPNGELLLLAEDGMPPCAAAAVAARRAAREGRYLLHDLHADGETPMIGFLAPVLTRSNPLEHPETSPVLGVTGLYLDPRSTLFPLVASPEPGGSTTLEVYLVRRAPEGAEVLSPGRGERDSSRALFLPYDDTRSAEVAALESKETVGWFRDYRGRSVLGAVRWISEAGWGLVVKVDEDEALAGWRREMLWETALLGAGFLCLLLGGVAVQRTWAGRRYRLLLGEIQVREERLRALAVGSDDVVFIKDLEGRFLLANPAASRVLGASPDQLPGRRSAEFLPPRVAEMIQAHDREALDSGRPFQGEEAIPVGGEERTFLSSRIPLRDGGGRVTGVAGVLRDITDRKRNEQALGRWAQTLGALYRLARALTVAEAADDVLRAVLDGAVESLGADVATLYLEETPGGDLVLVDSRGLDARFRSAVSRVDRLHGLPGRVLATGDVAVVEDCRSQPGGGSGAGSGTAEPPGVRSLAAVPLGAEGSVLGVLGLGFRQPRRFGRDEEEALQALGHMAGVALERARASAALEAESASRLRAEVRLRRLHDATAGLTGDELFRAVVHALGLELGSRWVLLARLEGGGQALPLAAEEGGQPTTLAPYALAGTPCAEVVERGQVVHYAQDVAARFPGDAALRDKGVEAYAGAPLLDSTGAVVGVLCCFHDRELTLAAHEKDVLDLYARRVAGEVERLFAEQNLAEARRALETLIRNLPGAVYRCSRGPDRPVDYVSAGVEALTGHPATAFGGGAGLSLGALVVTEDRARVRREIERSVAAGRSYEVEYRIHDAQGAVRWVFDVGRAVPGADGGGAALEGVLFDHTERRSLESQLTHSQRMEALGRLAGGVAHDFNNLLTAISGYAEMLAMRLPEGDRSHRAAREILRASDRAADLTRQLLAFSRRQVVEPKVLGLTEAAGQTARMLARLLGEDVEFVLELDPEAGAIRADPGQLEQVLLNLAVNARDAMPEGGRLTLRTYPAVVGEAGGAGELAPGNYAVLEVEDTGVGMTHEILEHIFEPFFTTKDEGKGTGLGLASVYGIVRQAGGRVEVDSVPGQGSTFRVHWPRWAEVEDAPGTGGDHRTSGSGEALLLVEDEDAVRDLAAAHLADCGYRVAAYPSAAAALEGLSSGLEVDVLITDVVMPGLGGPELARRVRETRPGLPVILVSGHTGEVVVELGGGDRCAFLQKPFRLADLEQAVEAALGKGAPA